MSAPLPDDLAKGAQRFSVSFPVVRQSAKEGLDLAGSPMALNDGPLLGTESVSTRTGYVSTCKEGASVRQNGFGIFDFGFWILDFRTSISNLRSEISKSTIGIDYFSFEI